MGRCSAAVSWVISCISLETTGLISLSRRRGLLFLPVLRRRRRQAVMQSDRRKRMSTITAPTTIPITTHRCSPKIDVLFESSVSINAVSKTDISGTIHIHQNQPLLYVSIYQNRLSIDSRSL